MLFCHTLLLFAVGTWAAILGIDFGQQFTKAVLLAPGISFELVLTDEGKRKDLSAISIRQDKKKLNRVFGSAASSICTRFPQSCVVGIKSLLGKNNEDMIAEEYSAEFPWSKISSDGGRSRPISFDLRLDDASDTFTVEELFAMYLRQLQARANREIESDGITRSKVDDVAISIPPFASQDTRQAYLDSLELAGFPNIMCLVDEGTAVALNYVSTRKFEKEDYNDKKNYYMIYDMGAGSTKATLFSYTLFSNGSTYVDIEGVGYDQKLGGQLFTTSIYELLLDDFKKAFKFDDDKQVPARVAARLKDSAEKAKIVLSVNADYTVSLENLYDDRDFKSVVTKEKFEDLNFDISERITRPILDALHGSVDGSTLKDVESIILNGGSTRIPFVQNHLASLVTEDKISKTVNADESCVQGVTLQGFKSKSLLKNKNDLTLIDRSFASYSVSVDGANFINVFQRGEELNTEKTVSFNYSSSIDSIDLFENSALIKSFPLEDLDKKASTLECDFDKRELVVLFELDQNKLVQLKKIELRCGNNDPTLSGSSETEVEDLKGDTSSNINSNSTLRKDKKSKFIKLQHAKPLYPRVKPISKVAKERIQKKLSELDRADFDEAQLDLLKNSLEADCYSLRSLLIEHEDDLLKELTQAEYENSFALVSSVIEWLESEHETASFKEVELKQKEVIQVKDKINGLVEMNNVDLTKGAIEKLQEDAAKIAMKVQSFMLNSGSEVNEIRKKFETQGFNFDKENDRLKYKFMKGNEKIMHLESALASYKDELTRLGSFADLSDKKFEKVPKYKLFENYKAVTSGMVDMLSDIFVIENSHKERIASLNDKFNQLLDRRNKQILRSKSKSDAKSSTLEEEGDVLQRETSKVNTDDATESSSFSDAGTETTIGTNDFEHDEL